jgi:hypothetical protein
MFEALRQRLKNAQPISTPSRDNFEQQDPSIPGSGHEKLIHHETGAGTRQLQIEKNLAKVEAQLSQTSDPGLRIVLLAAQRNMRNQLVRSGGSGQHVLLEGSPVPDVGFPMGSWENHFNPSDDYSGGVYDLKISPKAAFELAGTARSQITQLPPRGARMAGGMDPLSDSYYTRNALGTVPDQFNYDPGLVDTNATPRVHNQTPGGHSRVSFAPGRTFQDLHTGPDWGPYGRGLTTNDQPIPTKHGSRSVGRKHKGNG